MSMNPMLNSKSSCRDQHGISLTCRESKHNVRLFIRVNSSHLRPGSVLADVVSVLSVRYVYLGGKLVIECGWHMRVLSSDSIILNIYAWCGFRMQVDEVDLPKIIKDLRWIALYIPTVDLARPVFENHWKKVPRCPRRQCGNRTW